jgi:hypothetical protein
MGIQDIGHIETTLTQHGYTRYWSYPNTIDETWLYMILMISKHWRCLDKQDIRRIGHIQDIGHIQTPSMKPGYIRYDNVQILAQLG